MAVFEGAQLLQALGKHHKNFFESTFRAWRDIIMLRKMNAAAAKLQGRWRIRLARKRVRQEKLIAKALKPFEAQKEIAETLASLEALGARASYLAFDVCNDLAASRHLGTAVLCLGRELSADSFGSSVLRFFGSSVEIWHTHNMARRGLLILRSK